MKVPIWSYGQQAAKSGSQTHITIAKPPTKERSTQRAAWHDALLEANRMVTKKNLGRQDSFLNRVEDRLDDACLGVRDLVTERDALREAIERVIALRSSYEADRGNEVPLVKNYQARSILVAALERLE